VNSTERLDFPYISWIGILRLALLLSRSAVKGIKIDLGIFSRNILYVFLYQSH